MPSIRIVKTPDGEAPNHIRQAWVGLILPLSDDRFGRRGNYPGFGVRSRPRNVFGLLWRILTGKYVRYDGYAVLSADAIAVLGKSDPVAAQWWRKNSPHLVNPGGRLIFEAEVCEEIP